MSGRKVFVSSDMSVDERLLLVSQQRDDTGDQRATRRLSTSVSNHSTTGARNRVNSASSARATCDDACAPPANTASSITETSWPYRS